MMPDSSGTRLTCFLSSALRDSDIAQEIRQMLGSLDVEVRTADDLPWASNVASSIVDAVLSADFICVVLATDRNNPAVWYEAGIATGSQRPILVVAESAAIDQLPFDIFSAPTIRYQRDNPKALRDNLIAYVRQVQPIAAQLKIQWDRLIDTSQPPVRQDSSTASDFTEKAIQEQLVRHLTDQGILVASYRRVAPNKTVDALIGFPTLGDEFNPIVVEVKRNRSHEGRDVDQVLEYIDAVDARLAVLVYTESKMPSRFRIFGPVGIILVSANEILRWDYQRIIEELTRLRNQVVHSN